MLPFTNGYYRNQTIPECDQTLFQMASNFDNYWWEDDNVTALCTGNCSQAASDWSDALSDTCYEEYVMAYGKYIPASSVAERYTDGLNIVCLPSWYGRCCLLSKQIRYSAQQCISTN